MGAARTARGLCLLLLAGSCSEPPSERPAEAPADPAVATAETPWFSEEAAARGLAFEHVSGHDGRAHLMPEIMGGGAALFDMDLDGDLDAYLVQSGSLDPAATAPGNQLFRNDGEGRFVEATAGSGAAERGYGMGVACADVDDDGDEDLYVTNVGPDALLRNEDAGVFADVTADAGIAAPGWSASAAFFDLERDGDLDLYVTSYLDWSLELERNCSNTLGQRDYCDPQEYDAAARDVLFRNEGLGRFLDVSKASGVQAHPGTGLGIACADFDDDGWVDVFVANDGLPDFLWQNQRDGTLLESAEARGCAVDENGVHKAGMGVAIADVDRDGDQDLMVCNLNRESDSLFMNQGDFFTDRTSRAGLAATSKPFTRFGMGLFDLDNDGLVDLYQANGRVNELAKRYADDGYAEPNLLFAGTSTRFREVTPRGGTATPLIATSRAAAFGDVDGDGALDILVVNRDGPAHLLMNGTKGAATNRTAPHWIALSVRERSGRHAIGATLELTAGETKRRREVRAASSYLSSHDPTVHVGLGPVEQVDAVGVRWADGRRESFGPLAVDRLHVLSRGQGRPQND